MTFNYSHKQLNDRIDSIHGNMIALASAIDKRDDEKISVARRDVESKIANFMGLFHIADNESIMNVYTMLSMRTGRFSKEGVKILSGSSFRKFIRDEIYPIYHIVIDKPMPEKKARVKTVKDENGNVRPMTADELRAWDEKRLAKIEKEMEAIRARMAK